MGGADESAAGRLLILVVEDDDDLRTSLCLALGDAGYRAVGAHNGLHALAQLQEIERPNLIILDLMMPVMNGWDFHTHLKANPEFSTVPVLLLSAYVRRDTHTGPKDVEGALQKPVSVDDLLAWVRRLAVRLQR
jgi:CheY-like chemotaxis protein